MECSDRQQSLLSASRRHVADASRLRQTSPDQSWHLAGFGPECARKALIFDARLRDAVIDKAIGHDFSGVRDEDLLEWVVRLDPWAHRYTPTSWAEKHPILSEWDPRHRYEATGTAQREKRDVEELNKVARALVDRITVEFWMDGHLPSDWSPES